MFALHSSRTISVETLINKKYDGSLVFKEIALFAGAHQRSTKLFLTLAIAGKLMLPFVARLIEFKTLRLQWDGTLYTVMETISLSLFLL